MEVLDRNAFLTSRSARRLNAQLQRVLAKQDQILFRWVPARDLLTPARFDLMAKYLYAKTKVAGIHSRWAFRLYDEHIKVFNGYVENDASRKCGIDAFTAAFDQVIDSVQEGGLDADESIVPVTMSQVILDGAHRVAAALVCGREVPVVGIEGIENTYDYSFFRDRGLSGNASDAMALEYCKLRENTFVVTVFPAAKGRNEDLLNILSRFGRIVYAKEVSIARQAAVNLIRQFYTKEPWVGSISNGFLGAQEKAAMCYPHEGPTRVFVLEAEDLATVNKAKDEIRALYGVGKHSVHINDAHEETVYLAQILLNENSIHFINHAQIRNYGWFDRLLRQYASWLQTMDQNQASFVVDSSSVMAAYGIREARDLDFLYSGSDIPDSGFKEIGCHNSEAEHYSVAIDDLVHDPAHHFFFYGLKFVTLDTVKTMKRRRGETKDLEDVALIEAFLSSHQNHFRVLQVHQLVRNLLSPRFYLRRLRHVAIRIRFALTIVRNRTQK